MFRMWILMIGNRVKSIREKRKMTISELATKAKVAKSYISTLERNLHSNPSIQFLEKIAAVLDVPVDSLLDKQTEPKVIDPKWIEIIMDAQDAGVSKESIQEFIEFMKQKMNN